MQQRWIERREKIQQALNVILSGEQVGECYSDTDLSGLLALVGISATRLTVWTWRKKLGIPNSEERNALLIKAALGKQNESREIQTTGSESAEQEVSATTDNTKEAATL